MVKITKMYCVFNKKVWLCAVKVTKINKKYVL